MLAILAAVSLGLTLALDREKVQNADAFPTATRIQRRAALARLHVAGVGTGWRRRHLTMSNTPISEPSEQSGWLELGWDDEDDSERAPVLGAALLAALALVTCLAIACAIWLLATGQLG
jgi:hypothetical protein